MTDKDLHVVVRAVILGDNKEILFGRRIKEPSKGRLSLFGGKPEIGESPQDTLIREVREETNLEVTSREFLQTHIDSSTTPDQPWIVHTFRCTVTGTMRLKTDEHSEAIWLTREMVATSEEIAFDHKELVLRLVN